MRCKITFTKNGKILSDEEIQMIIFQKLEELKQKNKEAKKSRKGDMRSHDEKSMYYAKYPD